MDSPSSVYSETSPPSPIPVLALQPPLFSSANYSSELPGMMSKRSFGDVWADTGFKPWTAPKKVLKSMVTDDEFIIGSPQDSLLCRRRIWSRKAARGLLNPGNWQGSVDNQIRYNAKMEINKEWREAHGDPLHRPEMFRSIDWNAPATFRQAPVSPRTVPVSPSTIAHDTTARSTAYWSVRDGGPDEQITATFRPTADPSTASSTPSPPDSHLTSRRSMSAIETSSQASSKSLAPAPIPIAGPTVSIYSLARFVDAEAPGFFGLISSTTSQSPSSPDFQIEDAVIGQATLAMPIAIPPRGPSLLNLRVLEAGIASRARRPILLDSDSTDSDSSSSSTHHTNLMPATLELGVATAVRMVRPAPVRLVVVRAGSVPTNQADFAALETASALDSQDEGGCSPRSNLWSKLKRKFHRG
ncbi:hypothetical protein M409DRAFT_23685 [Zasmidium cellare ATCC 36951]|uniref:Uncharacterized protein n=1 Tax=Zasmidium cellare ATCC 36951 TaxID=1080233 RepID=A0A6A6CFN5_ZASCE|nr:uncharacterized protein M409DRAFT_23685 [Zasmidium cellare ATCC 36951]KAF2165955.1 hypothetical protein M409DRAFT_23685 [Zasmidium cellare ATCC 36951]